MLWDLHFVSQVLDSLLLQTRGARSTKIYESMVGVFLPGTCSLSSLDRVELLDLPAPYQILECK
jgi:hypothetical protein